MPHLYSGTLFDMSGTTTLVAGANAGIGLAIADIIASAGGNIVIWGRRADRNAEAAEKLLAHGVKVLAQSVDVIDEKAVDSAFAEAVAQMGDIQAVFSNAGLAGRRAPLTDLSVADFTNVLNINLIGSFCVLRAAARHMTARGQAGRKGGSIVITGSLVQSVGLATSTSYTASKGALAAIVRTLAVELGPHAIRVNAMVPGVISSEIGQSEAAIAWAKNSSPLGRTGEPEEIVGLALYLASKASTFHTGDNIAIDGGVSAGR